MGKIAPSSDYPVEMRSDNWVRGFLRRHNIKSQKHNGSALLFLFPLLLILIVFYAYGFVFLLQTSFQKTTIAFKDPVYIGFENYRILLSDADFYRAIVNNFIFAGVAVTAGLTLAFFLAAVVSFKLRGHRIFNIIFLSPSFVPVSLVASVLTLMLEYRFGTVNEILRGFGLGFLAQRWLTDSNLSYLSISAALTYLIGLPILYYTADLTIINTELLEASMIDGANTWEVLRLVLFPLVRSARRTIIVSTIIGSFRMFEVVYLMTNQGSINSTQITGTYLFEFATSGISVGYVSAAAVIVSAIALTVSLLTIRVFKYE